MAVNDPTMKDKGLKKKKEFLIFISVIATIHPLFFLGRASQK
jgi:hypothetical protein